MALVQRIPMLFSFFVSIILLSFFAYNKRSLVDIYQILLFSYCLVYLSTTILSRTVIKIYDDVIYKKNYDKYMKEKEGKKQKQENYLNNRNKNI